MKKFMNRFSAVLVFVLILMVSVAPAFADENISANGAYQFSRTLSIGSTGEDVYTLQRWLNSNGFMVATTGAGSLGHETHVYGTLTAKAVKKFQEVYGAHILASAGLSQGTGKFADASRSFLNSALEKNTTGIVLGAFTSNK